MGSVPAEATDKLVKGPRTKLLLALGSLLVLALGFLVAPPRVLTETPKERVAPILQETVERREPARIFRAIQETGRAAAAFSVAFPAPEAPRSAPTYADFGRTAYPPRPPAGFGVVVSGEPLVLTHVAALGGHLEPAVRLADGKAAPGRVTVCDPESGFVLVRLEAPSLLEAPRIGREPIGPGELVVLAARAGGREMLAPVFVVSTDGERYALSAAVGSVLPGTPLFGVGGEVVALTGGPPAFEAHAIGPMLDRLRGLAAEGRGLPGSIGVFLQDLTGGLAREWPEGALIADVREGGAAARAGLRAGDIVVGVAGADVRTVGDAV
ncbi:MAG TPA: S1C family serine protease, partial [Vicinamibacteria bacterium]|nr:S1C family serine protease [Vicinamibacteria bacterium]